MMKACIAFLILVLSACDSGTGLRADSEKLTLETGGKFAQALVDGKYLDAKSLLTQQLQQQYPPETLQARYTEMTSYGEGPVKVDGHTKFMGNWPAREPMDIGWAYISISGADFAEAVTVVVADENGVPKIREIEWGRP
jgi:hypothetical protein